MSDLLAGVDQLHWRDDLVYIEGDRSAWSPATRCAVIERDPYEEEDPEATIDGVVLRLALSGSQTADVVRNLAEERPSTGRFVDALAHFHEFDGFLPE